MTDPLLRVVRVKKYFPVERGIGGFGSTSEFVHAVDGVSLAINQGQSLSLVGETGSGKTTLALMIALLAKPTVGEIFFDGKDISALRGGERRSIRRDIQMIFQDPYASLNPRKSVENIVGLPIKIHKIAHGDNIRQRVCQILEMVGLSPGDQYVDRGPHELSGGQRQRVAIARALSTKPKFIVADEPVSSLDVSVRSQILNLMRDLKAEFNLTYLFIAHDLSVVRYMSDYVAVMYLGEIVEYAPTEELYSNPQHPYTHALLHAIPVPDPAKTRIRIKLQGEMPSPIHPPTGCRFHTRCPYAEEICKTSEPILRSMKGGHLVACHLAPIDYGN